jgi:hypothetical protein
MAHTNNTPIDRAARLRFDAAPGTSGQTLPLHLAAPTPGMTLQLPPPDDMSFVAAQRATRAWADKALVLAEGGDTEQGRYARFQAEAWLVRMLALEALVGKVGNKELPKARPRTQRRSAPAERREGKLNNSALRTWSRSLPAEPAE